MWIREAVTEMPRHGWTAVVLGWCRTVFTALAAVGLGRLLDAVLGARAVPGNEASGQVLAGPDVTGAAWFVAGCVLAAALCALVAEALPERMRGEQERLWRSRVMTAALAGPLLESDAPESDAPARASDGGRPAAVGHERPGGHPCGRPGGSSGGHPGGHPGSHPGAAAAPADLRAAVLDGATTGVEKTAGYRATFLGPTLASWSSPLLVLLVGAVLVDPLWSLALLGFVALVPVLILVFGKRLRGSNADYRRLEAAETRRYLETLEGLGTLVAFGAEHRYRDRLAASVRSTMHELGGLLARNQRMIVVNDAVFSLGMTTAATGLALWLLQAGRLSLGDALAALLLAVLLLEPTDRVGRSFYVGLAGRARRDGLERLLSRFHAPAPQPELDVVRAPSLELRQVSVSLAGKPVLQEVDLVLPAGARVALVGPSGAGKTTLSRLVSGQLEAASGQLLVDGVPTTAAQRRGLVSVLSQTPALFSTTIADNLRAADPGASDDELWQALRQARLADEVAAMPQRLQTPVGDAGSKLSGGQRRRLALARVLLRRSPVLLLDEPTADLDRRTEHLVGRSLELAREGRTSLLVAHRLSTTTSADLVVVLEQGRVTAASTPAELLAAPGWFADAHAAEQTLAEPVEARDGEAR